MRKNSEDDEGISKDVLAEIQKILSAPPGALFPQSFGAKIRNLMTPIVEIKTYEDGSAREGHENAR